MTFLVDPGKRVYVRHISFDRRRAHAGRGAAAGDAPAGRRLGVQLSAGALEAAHPGHALHREGGLTRRPRWMAPTTWSTSSTPIKEGPSATLTGGIGYSESSSFMLQGSYADSNFLGHRQARVVRREHRPLLQRAVSFSHSNQYVGIDNISRTVSLRYSDVSQFVSASSDFSSKNIGAALEFGYPITELQRPALRRQRHALAS